MEILTRHDLRSLIQERQDPFVSIFMPAHRLGEDTEKDAIRLKNLTKEAETRLIDQGVRPAEARRLLDPVQTLIEDNMFWRYQSSGLSLFLSPSGFRRFRLPLRFRELVVVGDRPYVKPLLPLFSGDGRFFVLALSQNQVRLLQGTRFSIDPVDLGDIPTDAASVLHQEGPERQVQSHSRTQGLGTSGGRAAIFHGHHDSDFRKQSLVQFFRELDKGLGTLLENENAPLVLAGVEYLFPIYREVNSYPHLMQEGVTGNPEGLRDEELHQRAWELVHPLFQTAQLEDLSRYRQLMNTAQATNDIRRIVPAAHHGQIDALFTTKDKQLWGIFDPQKQTVDLHPTQQEEDQDLLESSVVQTLLHRGTVHVMPSIDMPATGPIAAVLRY